MRVQFHIGGHKNTVT